MTLHVYYDAATSPLGHAERRRDTLAQAVMIMPLYPQAGPERALHGLYLGERVHTLGSAERPLVYANFVTSLDGRIALVDDNGAPYLPGALTGANDFRLFLELHAQADCLITHGGYLRAVVDGKLGNILQVGRGEAHADLSAWRAQEGLAAQPDVVVASSSLDFPAPDRLIAAGQRVFVATGDDADPERVRQWRARGYEVLFAGRQGFVEADALVRALGERGYRCLYLLTGPRMLESMLAAGRLSRLYVTITHQLLGGSRFHSMLQGERLGEQGQLHMASLYYDVATAEGVGQWFARFTIAGS